MEGSIFFPVIDNGQGSVKRNFMMCCFSAFAKRFLDDTFYMPAYSDSLVTRARNRAAAEFLRGKRDYLLFIDCDIVFTKDHIDMIMQHDDPLVSGIYCKKEPEVAPCYNLLEDSPPQAVGGLVEIKRAGTGFLRIARVVLERMKENPHVPHWSTAPIYKNHGMDEWDFFPTGVKDHEYLSEDWYFCDRARALGFKVMCDTRIQTKHEGTTFYPTDEAVKRQMEREKQMITNANLLNLTVPINQAESPGVDSALDIPRTTLEPSGDGQNLSLDDLSVNVTWPKRIVTPTI